MAKSASRYVYEVSVDYTGDQGLKRLQEDLNKLSRIDAFRSASEDLKKLRAEAALAKTDFEKLETAFNAGGGQVADLAALNEARRKYEELERAVQRQMAVRRRAAEELKNEGVAVRETAKRYAELQKAAQTKAQAAGARSVLGTRSDASIKAEIDGVKRAYRDLAASGTASTAELQRAAESLRTKLGNLRGQLSGMSASDRARNLLGLPKHSEIQAEIEKVRRAYQTLMRDGSLTGHERSQAHVAMLRQTAELRAQTNGWTEALGRAKGQIIALAGAFASVGKGVKLSIEFETNMADVRKTVGGTKAEIESLGRDLRRMALRIPIDPNDLARIAAIGGQLGMAREEILKFTDITAKMGAAFDMSAEEAGNAIGKMKNVFQLDLTGVEAMGDAVNQLGNNMAARERDIIDVMLRIGGTSKQFGIADENAAALAATFLALGRPAEVAGTAINSMLNRLQTGRTQSKGFHEALAALGTDAEEMAAKIQASPQKALDDLLEKLSKLEGMERAEILTGLFGREFQDDVGVLVGSLDTYRKALGLVADETKYTGAMNEEFGARIDTTGAKLQLLKNAATDIWRSIGDGFKQMAVNMTTPWLTPLLKGIADAVREFPKITALATGFTGIAVAIKPLQFLLANLGLAARAARTALVGLGAAQTVSGIAGLANSASGVSNTATAMGRLSAALKGMRGLSLVSLLGAPAPVLLGIAAAIGAATLAWKLFGDSASNASDRHAKAAAKIAGDIEAEKGRIKELRDLQQTLLTTASGTKEHTEAEQRLAQILPGVNTHIDEQGRLVATLTDKTSENNRKLEEHIALLEKRNAARENERLREAALAYAKAAEELEKNAEKAKKLHDAINSPMNAGSGLLSHALAETLKNSEKLIQNFDRQKGALDGLLRSMAQAGKTVPQLEVKLIDLGLSPEDRYRAVNEYKSVIKQIQAEAEQTADAVADAANDAAGDIANAGKVTAKDLSNAYKAHLQDVRRLQEEISGRQKSLTAELRDMARGGMNDADAWVDQRNAAKEYIKLAKQAADEARRAQAAGDTITAAARWKEAVQYADDARAAYKALNHEVKDGDRVVISAQTALKGAMRGVKEAGELGISFLKEQEQAAANAAREMEKTTSMADLTSEMDAAEKKWVEGWRRIGESAAESARQVYNVWKNEATGFWTNVDDEFSAGWSKTTDAMNKDWQSALRKMEDGAYAAAKRIERAFQIQGSITMTEKRRWGGLVEAFKLARGGKLPGYGGGDRIPALLESGEFVVRKEAVRRFGVGVFDALNHLRLPELPDLSALLPRMPQAAAATPGRTVNINLTLPSGDTYQMTTDPATAARIEREQERWWALRSSNKVKRSGFARTR